MRLWRRVMVALTSFRRGINNSEVLVDFVGFMKKHVRDELAGSAPICWDWINGVNSDFCSRQELRYWYRRTGAKGKTTLPLGVWLWMRPSCHSFIPALFLLLTQGLVLCFVSSALTTMVGWQEGHPARKRPVTLVFRGSLPEIEEEDLRGNKLIQIHVEIYR